MRRTILGAMGALSRAVCRIPASPVMGQAGNGETITCEDNNGWRWEPT